MTRDQDWTTTDYVVVDVEGNGARPPQLVELALLRVHQGHVGPVTTWLVRPPEPITWQAHQVHGIRNRDVADAPTIDDVADDVLEALGDSILVGHAVHVDVAALSRALPSWTVPDTIDTLRLARRAFDLPSYSLSDLARHRRLNVNLPLRYGPTVPTTTPRSLPGSWPTLQGRWHLAGCLWRPCCAPAGHARARLWIRRSRRCSTRSAR